MGVVITREDIRAYAEVHYIIHHMNVRYLEMLPAKIVAFLEKMKDPTYEVFVDTHKPLQSQGLQRYTLEIIALLHLKYWCEDEERKKELYNRMETNQFKFEEHIREKFGADTIFADNKEKIEEKKEDLSKPKKINIIQAPKKAEEIVENVKQENNDGNKELTTENNEGILKKIIKKIKNIFQKN